MRGRRPPLVRAAFRLCGALPLAAALALIAGCRAPAAPAADRAADSGSLPFVDVAEQAGLRFRHETGATGRYYLPETMGSGCAFFDYDGDGWPDIYLVQRAALPGFRPTGPLRNRLFRNLGNGRFEEVPGAAGLDDPGYGMGCCAADIDNDGDLDVFVTNFGRDALYRNDGGRFVNITDRAGVGGPAGAEGWSASAAFGDYDRDGFVDLYVTVYVAYDPRTAAGCRSARGKPGYCPPEVFPPTRDRLYRNRGDGTFEDVTAKSGIGSVRTRGLGVVFVDDNRDGWPDIYVACDQSPNVLWRNRRDGTFENVAPALGAAYGEGGQVQNGMGVDFADPDHDGDMDGFVTNFSGQPNSYYGNAGPLGFLLRSAESGLGPPSVPLLGFGCNFLDFDLDGWEDLLVVNGHVNDHIAEDVPGITYAQPCSLFRNLGGRFAEVPAVPGRSLWRSRVSRGSAIADYDRDGDPDILISNCGDRAELFRNQARRENHWLAVRLEGTASNRSAIGARIRLTAGSVTQVREVRAGSSYLSQSDLVQTFGLGRATRVQELVVDWPSGRRSRLRDVPAGRLVHLREPGR